jgi:hypothetical protein
MGMPQQYIVMQSIIVRWMKRQRTSQHARLRAALPHALPLPQHAPLPAGHVGLAGDIYFHAAQYGPTDAYRSPHEQWRVTTSRFPAPTKLPAPGGLIGADIICHPLPEGMQIEFDWAQTGRRPWLVNRREQRTLVMGAWLQLRFNARVLTWDDPYYMIHILNIGYAAELARDLFTASAPLSEIVEWHQLL